MRCTQLFSCYRLLNQPVQQREHILLFSQTLYKRDVVHVGTSSKDRELVYSYCVLDYDFSPRTTAIAPYSSEALYQISSALKTLKNDESYQPTIEVYVLTTFGEFIHVRYRIPATSGQKV